MMGIEEYNKLNGPSKYDLFIDNLLIPKYKAEFQMNNVSILPFQNLLPYTDSFIETLNSSDTIEFQLHNHTKKSHPDYSIKSFTINGKPSSEPINIKSI